jgi:hypothetical protein
MSRPILLPRCPVGPRSASESNALAQPDITSLDADTANQKAGLAFHPGDFFYEV